MSNSYKTDERVLKEIVVKNVSCVNDNDELKLEQKSQSISYE